jgi:hypothetical protein
MDYIFESLINRYDELVIQEYCYGGSYYTEEAKIGLLQKIGKFISDLCVKIMNKIKEIINKISGKEIYVKAPRDMEKKVKEVDGWLGSFKKLVAAIKNGVVGAIKQLLGLMKNHPIVTGAILATGGYIMVRSGLYDKWCKKFGSITQRIKDGIAVIMGKKEFVEKGEYEAAVEASTNAKAALVNSQKLLDECKIENIKANKSLKIADEELGSTKNKLRDTTNRYGKLARVARDGRMDNKKLKEDISKANIKYDIANANYRDMRSKLQNEYASQFLKKLRDRRKSLPGFKEFENENENMIDEFIDSNMYMTDKKKMIDAMNHIDKEFEKWKSSRK